MSDARTDPRLSGCVLLTVKDVGELLQMHPRSIWRASAAGDIPRPVRITPRCVRWRASDIDRFISKAKSA